MGRRRCSSFAVALLQPLLAAAWDAAPPPTAVPARCFRFHFPLNPLLALPPADGCPPPSATHVQCTRCAYAGADPACAETVLMIRPSSSCCAAVHAGAPPTHRSRLSEAQVHPDPPREQRRDGLLLRHDQEPHQRPAQAGLDESEAPSPFHPAWRAQRAFLPSRPRAGGLSSFRCPTRAPQSPTPNLAV